MSNRGHEVFVNVNLLSSDALIWDVGAGLATANSRVEDLGVLDNIPVGWRNYVQAPLECTEELSNGADFDGNGFIGQGCTPGELVYFPLPAFCHDRVQNPDEVAAPRYATQCLGSTTPTHTYNLNTTMTLGQRLTLDVVGEGMGGHWLSSGTAYQNARRSVWPTCRDVNQAISDGRRDQLTAGERALCDPSVTRYGMWTQPADFFKLRSVSLSYRLPQEWIPGRFRSATLRLQGRNLLTFTDYEGVDPEAFEDGSADVLFRQEYYNLPPFRSFVLSARVDF